MPWIPLPDGNNAAETIRRLRAIDAEFFGSIYAQAGVIGGDVVIQGSITGGDYTSTGWDGGSDLSGGADGSATTGFLLDDSAGAAQFQTLYAEGGELGSLDVVGNLTLDGGTILTSATGERIEITNDKIEFNTGTGTEYQVGQLYSSASGNTVRLEMFGHTVGTVSTELVRPRLRLIGDDGTSIDMDIVLGTSYSAVSPTKDVNTTISLVAHSEGSGVGEIHAYADGGFSLGDGVIGTGDPLMQQDNGATNPPWSFVGDTDTGMYRYSTNSIGFAGGGTLQFRTGSSGAPGLLIADGSESDPAIRFNGDTDTGLYRNSSNRIGFVSGGNRVWLMELTNTDESRLIPFDDTVNFYDTHLAYDDTDAQWRISINGTTELYLSSTQLVVPNVYNDSTSGSANVLVESNGRLRRATSALKYKENVQPAEWLADIEFGAFEWDDKESGEHHYGGIADYLAEQLPDAGEYNDEGELENYKRDAALAILAAKVNRLEERLNQCNCST